jgi:hypothetical protein
VLKIQLRKLEADLVVGNDKLAKKIGRGDKVCKADAIKLNEDLTKRLEEEINYTNKQRARDRSDQERLQFKNIEMMTE